MKVMARRIDNQDSLDPRTRQLLRALIGRYIRDGQPVGSQTLARHAGLDVSPATIRNILSDLEEIGLLAAPHTSAGRIPTARGLRVFVDSLIRSEEHTSELHSLLRHSYAVFCLKKKKNKTYIPLSLEYRKHQKIKRKCRTTHPSTYIAKENDVNLQHMHYTIMNQLARRVRPTNQVTNIDIH